MPLPGLPKIHRQLPKRYPFFDCRWLWWCLLGRNRGSLTHMARAPNDARDAALMYLHGGGYVIA
jgi:acetyl esterase/lipase